MAPHVRVADDCVRLHTAPDYRLIGAPFLAYGLVSAGALIRSPRLTLRSDVSYGTYIYAFPVQQLLASTSLAHLAVVLFAALAASITLVIATLSWFFVEEPALRRKH